jgi:hypothetical protein
MADLRQRVRLLEGRTLRTQRGAAFDVERVTDHGTYIHIRSSGSRRNVPWREIDQAYALGLSRDELTPARIRSEGASEFNPAYVAAILMALQQPPT